MSSWVKVSSPQRACLISAMVKYFSWLPEWSFRAVWAGAWDSSRRWWTLIFIIAIVLSVVGIFFQDVIKFRRTVKDRRSAKDRFDWSRRKVGSVFYLLLDVIFKVVVVNITYEKQAMISLQRMEEPQKKGHNLWKTSNGIIAGNGREMYMIVIKFRENITF